MNSPATTRTLKIDGMTGDACIAKVTGALKGVAGVTTHSVKVGSASIGADQNGCTAACAAIDGAGFKARAGSETGAPKADQQAQGKPAAPHTPNAPHSPTPPVGAAIPLAAARADIGLAPDRPVPAN